MLRTDWYRSGFVQFFLALVSIWFLFIPPSFASDGGILSLVYENDLFAQRDQYYTSGVRMTWFSGKKTVPDWFEQFAKQLAIYRSEADHRVTYNVGQNMFTPLDITDPNPPQDDRPYAGWLYGSAGLIQDRGNRLDTLEIRLGVVGPSARAKEVQEEVHKLVGSKDPRGWGTQLKDELGVRISYGQRNISWSNQGLWGQTFELMPGYSVSVGNILTAVEGSLMLRWGDWSGRDYGPPLIRSSIPGTGFYVSDGESDWYLYTNLSGRYVAHNLFLDGNTIHDSRSVDREPFLAEAQLGFVFRWSNYQVSYTHVFPTREFETQKNTDSFGAITVSKQF